MIRRMALAGLAVLVLIAGLAGCATSTRSPVRFTLQTVVGYLVPWDSRGTAALGEGLLTEVSPVWYQPEPDGQVVFASRQAERSLGTVETAASLHHVAIMPTISNYRNAKWDGELIHDIITSPDLRSAHIAAIVNVVQSQKWAGIDLDYESLESADRDAFSAFVQKLASALHQAHKRLTLTVHAKTAEPGDWSGARAQDWRALGSAADEIRVMAYDYATDNSTPGPIAPLPWVESVLQLAVSEIPRDKILLGVPTYGYDWPSGRQGKAIQWADAESLAQAHSAPVTWDPTSQSPWFAYTDASGVPHTVWYTNASSMRAVIDLALRYHISGIFIWQLGGEDPAIWRQIKKAT